MCETLMNELHSTHVHSIAQKSTAIIVRAL